MNDDGVCPEGFVDCSGTPRGCAWLPCKAAFLVGTLWCCLILLLCYCPTPRLTDTTSNHAVADACANNHADARKSAAFAEQPLPSVQEPNGVPIRVLMLLLLLLMMMMTMMITTARTPANKQPATQPPWRMTDLPVLGDLPALSIRIHRRMPEKRLLRGRR